MPNWSNNVIAFKGKEESILNMLNDGLLNSGADKCETLSDAIASLEENAKHKAVENDEVVLENGLRLRTFLPTPDTFLLYDTTNRPDEFADAVQEQKKTYKIVGWYDYNLATLGTKWDADLSIDNFYVRDGVATIVFYCETAWSYPEDWMTAMEQNYGVNAYILTKEEGGFYYFYGSLEKKTDLLAKTAELYDQYVKDSEEEDYDAYYEACEELWQDALGEFYDFLEKQ